MRWILAIGLMWIASGAHAQEWTRFRGPNGTGINPATLPTQWTSKDFLWKVPVPGRGISSPVLWEDQIFLTSAENKSGKRMVFCFDAATGKILWQREFPAAKYSTHQRNTMATSTPTVDAERLYLAWATPKQYLVQALDRKTGKDVWEADLGPYASEFGFGSSPIRYEDLLILSNDQDKKGSLIALEAATGKKVWELPRQSGNATYSTPCVYQPANQPAMIIFTNWKHGITAVDPRTGKVAWETSVFVTTTQERAVASPIVAGDLVIGTCGYASKQKHFVAVRPDGKGQATEVWRNERAVAYLPTPLVKDGKIFSCTEFGIMTCFEAATGKVIWQERLNNEFSGSLVCAGKAIYCVSNSGQVHVVEASEKFNLLATNSLGEATQCTPAIAGNRIFFRTDNHLIALGAAK